MFRTRGKVALVTGAGSVEGIGHCVARRLAEEGARIFATDLDGETGSQAAAELRDRGLDVTFMPLDVASESAWESAIGQLSNTAGRLDVLVNNAGVAFAATIADTTLERFRWLNGINLRGTYLGIKHAARIMTRLEHGGSIINLSSIAGHVGLQMYAAYCASKGGVKNLTKAAALELAPQGIRVNSVHPGVIWTPMNQVNFDSETAAREGTARLTPLKELGYPLDIADAAVFLASDESAFMTGGSVTVDGGMTAA